jgi:hypothetical protein
MSSGPPLAILRLAKGVSPGMPLLVNWTRSLKAGEPVRAFHDMQMAPTPIALVCAVRACPEGSTARNTTLDSCAVAERHGIVVPDGYATPVSIRPAVDTATTISWCPEDDDGEHASRAGRKTMPGTAD